ncbi:hypothetical protein BgiBS90_021851 [Biomphalaria glabrata]|nr:hypothetical protein BgiBS90_021851 [Biomphalaria glabrata]
MNILLNCLYIFSSLLSSFTPPARAQNRNQDGSLIMDRAAICIHPKSKPFRPPDAQYRTWSQAHRSTGSTVDTHIDQRSVFSGSGSFAYTLPSRR